MSEEKQNKHTAADLAQMQALSLGAKVSMTMNRIRWFMSEFDCYVSFSGGKDSTVLLHIIRQMYPDIPAVFVDTGLEYPEVREFALSQENIIRLRPEMNFRKVIETYGYPLISKNVSQKIYEYRNNPKGCAAKYFDGNSEYNVKYNSQFSLERWIKLRDSNIPISDRCCKVMKKKPAQQYQAKTGKAPFLATMACESRLRETAWLQRGCNVYDSKRPRSMPLSFWTEQDILQYIKENNLPYASVYGEIETDGYGRLYTTGCQRTGCVFCGFGCHLEKEPNRFQRLHETHPKLWEYCMKDWDKGGLGMQHVLDYIGVKTIREQLTFDDLMEVRE